MSLAFSAVDHLGPFGRQQFVERALVLRARLAVHRDEERLVAERIDVLLEVVGDELGHLLHAAISAQEGAQPDGSLQHLVEFFDVGDGLVGGEREELLVEVLWRHGHRRRRQHVLDRQRGFVVDRLDDRVLVEVALFVLRCRRSGTCPSACPVSRRPVCR